MPLCLAILFVLHTFGEMSEKKVSGFAAMMRKRKKEKEEKKDAVEEVKPVIKEVSLTCDDLGMVLW